MRAIGIGTRYLTALTLLLYGLPVFHMVPFDLAGIGRLNLRVPTWYFGNANEGRTF